MSQFTVIHPPLHLSPKWDTTQSPPSYSKLSFCDLLLTSIPSPFQFISQMYPLSPGSLGSNQACPLFSRPNSHVQPASTSAHPSQNPVWIQQLLSPGGSAWS